MIKRFMNHLSAIEPPEGLEQLQKTNEGIHLGN